MAAGDDERPDSSRAVLLPLHIRAIAEQIAVTDLI
jgi:hypothetical protein